MLYIDNFEIVRESVTKFLGIFIDENLTWKYHIEHVCNKVSKSIGIKYKSRNIISKRFMKQLCFSFIPQTAFTCSKLTIETLEQGVKYVQS